MQDGLVNPFGLTLLPRLPARAPRLPADSVGRKRPIFWRRSHFAARFERLLPLKEIVRHYTNASVSENLGRFPSVKWGYFLNERGRMSFQISPIRPRQSSLPPSHQRRASRVGSQGSTARLNTVPRHSSLPCTGPCRLVELLRLTFFNGAYPLFFNRGRQSTRKCRPRKWDAGKRQQ